jgi:hypothetical protein
MPIKKKTPEGPKAKLMKQTIPALRKKAKALGVSDYTKRTKENLVQSIMLAEARKKRGTVAAKKKPVKRKTMAAEYQTGKSNATYDIKYRAEKPGKRISKTGRVYYERRANRSDAYSMLGEKYNGWTNYWTWKFNLELLDEERWREFIEDGAYESIYDLAQDIKSDAEEFIAEGITPDFAEQWFLAALSFVNWNEIAQGVAEGTSLEK